MSILVLRAIQPRFLDALLLVLLIRAAVGLPLPRAYLFLRGRASKAFARLAVTRDMRLQNGLLTLLAFNALFVASRA